MNLPSVRQLQYFVRIAELGSYRRAAESFGMSQPPLTQQMQALEQRLGVGLFDRTERRVALTSAGESLLFEARRIISSLEECCLELSALDRGTSGRVRIGMTDDYLGGATIAGVLPFIADNPGIKLEATVGISTDLLAKLEISTIDVVFASPMAADATRIEQWLLPSTEIVLLVPTGHRLSAYARVPMTELHREPLIMMPETSASPFARRCRDLLIEVGGLMRVVHTSTNAALTTRLVAAGLGLSFATRDSLEHLPSNVIALKLDCDNPKLEQALFCRKGPRGAALRLLLDATLAISKLPMQPPISSL